MKGRKTYLTECQSIKETKINDIPKHGKSRSKIRQITIQNVAFYNAINGILETSKKISKTTTKMK